VNIFYHFTGPTVRQSTMFDISIHITYIVPALILFTVDLFVLVSYLCQYG